MKQLASVVFQLTINIQGDFNKGLIFRMKLFVSLVPCLPRKGKWIQILIVVGSMMELSVTVLQGLWVEGLNNVNSFLVSFREKPFHDIKEAILLNSALRSSSLLQILWARWMWARIQEIFLDLMECCWSNVGIDQYGLACGRQWYRLEVFIIFPSSNRLRSKFGPFAFP